MRSRISKVFIIFLLGVSLNSLAVVPSNAVTYPTEINGAGTLYPYVASLWYSDDQGDTWNQFCSGTLIKPDLILTAAHCARDAALNSDYDFAAQVGSDYYEANPDSDGWIVIKNQWWNPRYSKNSYANDIGLMLLDGQANVRTLPLPTASQVSSIANIKTYTLYGWGVDQNGDDPAVLQSAVLSDQTSAAKQYFKSTFNPTTMIAAGAYNKAERVYAGGCNGDSGSPLIAYVKGKPILAGVTSFGANSCDLGKPTVFAKVSYFLKDLAAGEIRIRN